MSVNDKWQHTCLYSRDSDSSDKQTALVEGARHRYLFMRRIPTIPAGDAALPGFSSATASHVRRETPAAGQLHRSPSSLLTMRWLHLFPLPLPAPMQLVRLPAEMALPVPLPTIVVAVHSPPPTTSQHSRRWCVLGAANWSIRSLVAEPARHPLAWAALHLRKLERENKVGGHAMRKGV